ncbi:hypothetical protein A6V39_00740 [Candidatus Mycoplasma haematobovis]|uniref:Uncharacterized protein n=1 Tax=Candidatus Mycoplasma haematobovis TaxID=432608 RepID=A0A1A9QEB3_9MOLU|nr:hypothetical protein [Candidatus Mycoplasma haematobovis]OAL10578.1 hypothetical protein A6V39_00740 [Candidatus Mycoplasma haematobovis]
MQLRITPPLAVKAAGSSFKPSISAVLSGLTTAGTCTAVVLNSSGAKETITSSLGIFREAFTNSYLYDGIKKTTETFGDWFAVIINSKDDFRDWVKSYLGPDGLKSGTVEFYNKLHSWVDIVYNWFATKFIEFIGNIPEMVKNWDKLRLSLFKWGTFLGGGGGSALWAMFGTGANWSKLGDLMGHPHFEDMMNDLNQLVQDNEEAFKEMGSEGIEDILQKYLDNPEEAREAAKELLKEQKEMNEKDQEEKKEKQELSSEEIKEKFNPSQAGQPPTVPAVFSGMVTQGLKKLLSNSYSFAPPEDMARKAMNEYLSKIEADVEKEKEKSNRKPSVKAKFWDIIKDKKEEFVNTLAIAAKKAYDNATDLKLKTLTDKFVEALTAPCENEEQCDAGGLVEALEVKD